jgi:effector-binding domain-containing protein/uncharacterized protein YndB with AHSA1/START domain
MRVLKVLLGLVLVLVLVFVGVGWFLPDRVHVERSVLIEREAAVVFDVLDDFDQFSAWSPWAEMDPSATYDYSGPGEGVGATMRWSGNEQVGSGTQQIIEAVPNERVVTALDFGEMGRGIATFRLEARDGATQVTWGFDTDFEGDLAGRWFGLFFDQMLGPDYEKGLTKLKALVESLPARATAEGEDVEFEPLTLLYVRGTAPVDDTEAVGLALAEMYGEITELMTARGLAQVGAPLTVTHALENGVWRFDAGIPVDRNDVELSGAVQAGESPGGKAIRYVHLGPYDGLSGFREAVMADVKARGLSQRAPAIEQYVSDPGDTPPESLVTHLIVPVE